MSAMFSLRPFLVLLCAFAVPVFVGGILAGCGSSSTAAGGGTIETTGVSDPGSSQDSTQKSDDQTLDNTDPGVSRNSESEVYATGRVVYPDTTAVPKAYVSTEPYAGAVLADSSGRFQLTKPLPEGELTFIAEKGEREGQTVVPVPGDRIQKTVWIVVGGGKRSLNAISIDSVRANPGGPGLKRTGN
jgi:hypothetical protein